MQRRTEPELMELQHEVDAYSAADFSQVNQAFVDRLLEQTASLTKIRALDLGTGPGDIPIRLARARPEWHITAVDAAPAMLSVARETVAKAGMSERIELLLADAKGTRLPAAAFDLIFSNSIIHHVSNIAAFWLEVKRLAAPGAQIFMRDLARPDSEAQARAIVATYAGTESTLLQEEYFRSLLAAYTPHELRAQLDSAGLRSLQVAMSSDRHLDVFGGAKIEVTANSGDA